MFIGLIREQAGRELLKREGAGHSCQSHGFQGTDVFERFGEIPCGVSRRRHADGCGEGTGRLVEWLLVQGAVERGEPGYVRREARRRRFEVAAHAGDDIKG